MSDGSSTLPPPPSPPAAATATGGTTPATAQLTKKPPHRPTTSFHFFAGLASGVTTAVLLQPADLLKTRVQQSGSKSSSLRPVLRAILAGPNPLTTLWRGTLPSALRTGVGSALYFTSLNALRQGLANAKTTVVGAGGLEEQQQNQAVKNGRENTVTGVGATGSRSRGSGSSVLPKLSSSQNMLTGAVARVMVGFLMMPVTVIKVRYESDFYAYRSMYSASRDILMREGVRGFFSGFGATAIRDAPYAGLYVVFYEGSKKRLNDIFLHLSPAASANNTTPPPSSSAATAASINFASGVFAAGLATSISNPFDAVKTRLQLLPGRYGNTLKAARTMLREDGWRCFFDGLGLRMARKALSSALAWTVYEELIGRAERKFTAHELELQEQKEGKNGRKSATSVL